MSKSFSFGLLLTALLLTTSACKKQENAGASMDSTANTTVVKEFKTGTTHGVVMKIDTMRQEITLHHDSIPGIMEGMTMPFRVAEKSLTQKVKVGDSVTFTVKEDVNSMFNIIAIDKR
ncbi:MAG: copper-binding protein [Candidatus Kapaibacterium sp.]